jgi:hypothetical protein
VFGNRYGRIEGRVAGNIYDLLEARGKKSEVRSQKPDVRREIFLLLASRFLLLASEF